MYKTIKQNFNDPAYRALLVFFVICILFTEIHGNKYMYRTRTKTTMSKLGNIMARLRTKMDSIAEDIFYSIEINKRKLLPAINETKEDWSTFSLGED